MAKMHSKGKGISSSALPFDRAPPEWCEQKSEQVSNLICKLAKQGLVPSQIGVFLRDCKGIPQTKNITGKNELPKKNSLQYLAFNEHKKQYFKLINEKGVFS